MSDSKDPPVLVKRKLRLMNEVLPKPTAPTPFGGKTARERTMSRMKQLTAAAAVAGAAAPACHSTTQDSQGDAGGSLDAHVEQVMAPVDAGAAATSTPSASASSSVTTIPDAGTNGGKLRVVRPVATPTGYRVVDPMPRPARDGKGGNNDNGF